MMTTEQCRAAARLFVGYLIEHEIEMAYAGKDVLRGMPATLGVKTIADIHGVIEQMHAIRDGLMEDLDAAQGSED